MSRLLTNFVAALALVAAPACAANQTGGAPTDYQAQLAVENRSTADMDLYVVSDRGGSVRLGLVPASETTTFKLTPSMLAGAGTVRFRARPLRGGEPVISDPYKVRPGEQIEWSLPPQ